MKDFNLKKYLAEGRLLKEWMGINVGGHPRGGTTGTNKFYPKFDKDSLRKALGDADDAIISISGENYIIYNPDSNNQNNADMWIDKSIFAIDKDGDDIDDTTGEPLPEPTPGSDKIPDKHPVVDPKGSKEWWWKDINDRWQDEKSRTPGTEPYVKRLTDKALADLGITPSEAPDAKQAELIDFVSKLKNVQKRQLKDYIAQAMSGRAKKVGH